MEQIVINSWSLPFFNDLDRLREIYQAEDPKADFNTINARMLGALSVYIPEQLFEELLISAKRLAEARKVAN